MQKISAEGGIAVGSVHSTLHKNVNKHYLFQHLFPKIVTPEHSDS
jgi:hypothetical protein